MQNDKMSQELKERQREVVKQCEENAFRNLTFGDLQSAYDRARDHLGREDKNHKLALNTLSLLDWILAEIHYVDHGHHALTPRQNPSPLTVKSAWPFNGHDASSRSTIQ